MRADDLVLEVIERNDFAPKTYHRLPPGRARQQTDRADALQRIMIDDQAQRLRVVQIQQERQAFVPGPLRKLAGLHRGDLPEVGIKFFGRGLEPGVVDPGLRDEVAEDARVAGMRVVEAVRRKGSRRKNVGCDGRNQ